MKTFIAEDVLRDYSAGMVVVIAETREDAINMVIVKYDSFYSGEIIENLKEAEPNKIYSVHGGG